MVASATGLELAAKKFEQTRDEEWPDMTNKQRLGAVAATALCLARPVREIVMFGKPNNERGWVDTIGDIIFAASDGLDGAIARGTGGKTAIGGVTDPLGDKYARCTKELSMASRGRMSPIHPVIRIGRDLWVTHQREKITEETGGTVSVDASPKSDPLSGKYSTAHSFITNILFDSPIGENMPRWTREALATATDVHLVATGIASVWRLKKSARAAKK